MILSSCKAHVAFLGTLQPRRTFAGAGRSLLRSFFQLSGAASGSKISADTTSRAKTSALPLSNRHEMTMATNLLTPADGVQKGTAPPDSATQTPPLAEACRGPATMPLGILDDAARQPVYTMARQPRPLNRVGTAASRRG